MEREINTGEVGTLQPFSHLVNELCWYLGPTSFFLGRRILNLTHSSGWLPETNCNIYGLSIYLSFPVVSFPKWINSSYFMWRAYLYRLFPALYRFHFVVSQESDFFYPSP